MKSKNTPKVRFEGFSEHWRMSQLINVVKEVGTGKSNYTLNDKLPKNTFAILGSTSVIGYDETYDYEGDFILTARVGANAGNLYRYCGKVKITDNTVFIQGNNLSFLFSLLKNYNLKRLSFGTGMPLVKSSELKKLKFYFPSSDEQEKVGIFFKQLDDAISLQQRQLEYLKDSKQGFLQKLFPKDGERVPEVRFIGFIGKWEQRKIIDVSKETYGGGTPKTSVKEYWRGDIPWIQSSDLKTNELNNVIPSKFITEEAINESATKIIPENSIAIVTRVGVGKLALIRYAYCTSQDFLSLSSLNTDAKFVLYSLYKVLKKEINNLQGTSIKGITKTELLKKKVMIPEEREEQQKIGEFFKQLDDTIALNEKELDLLKETKKGFLQKMFV